jgi:hypothetical protein
MDLKERQILIFKNKQKKTEKHPDATGWIEINGKVNEISLWNRKSKDGKSYVIGSWNEPYNSKAKEKEKSAKRSNVQEDDDAPF